jgi:hypothetical protein
MWKIVNDYITTCNMFSFQDSSSSSVRITTATANSEETLILDI